MVYDNYIVFNSRKCCYMTFGSITTNNEFVLEDSTVAEEHVVLGITIDTRMTFYPHLNNYVKRLQIN